MQREFWGRETIVPSRFGGLLMLLFLASATSAAVVDRIAVIIGITVITETEVLEELRLAQFVNRQPLNFGREERLAAAERLIDQQILRNEMHVAGYSQSAGANGDVSVFGKFRQENFGSQAEYLAALAQYGVTGDQVKRYLLWQLFMIRFAEDRFRLGTSISPAGTDGEPTTSVKEQMDAWLKIARGHARIILKPEAFQ